MAEKWLTERALEYNLTDRDTIPLDEAKVGVETEAESYTIDMDRSIMCLICVNTLGSTSARVCVEGVGRRFSTFARNVKPTGDRSLEMEYAWREQYLKYKCPAVQAKRRLEAKVAFLSVNRP